MSAWGNLIDPEHHVCYYLSSLIETYWHTRKSSLHLCSTDFKFFSLYCIPKYQLFISRELKIYPKYPSLIDFKHFRTSLNVWKIDHGHEVQYIYRLGEKVTGVKQSERSVQKVSLSGDTPLWGKEWWLHQLTQSSYWAPGYADTQMWGKYWETVVQKKDDFSTPVIEGL